MRVYCKFSGPVRILAGAAIGLVVLATSVRAQEDTPFEMLVVGDSHISGQGLREENRFYYLVKDWLEREGLGGSRRVNLKVKAHSGARITLHPHDVEVMSKSGDDPNKAGGIEANLSSPSIRAQIDAARAEYKDPSSVDMIMLSGCITDVLVANTINPFYPKSKVLKRIQRFCNESMSGLLEYATATFPRAHVVVVGYYPIMTTKGDINEFYRYFFKVMDFPEPLEFVLTNPVSKLFVKLLRKKVVARSRLWLKESNRELRTAVARANARFDGPRVHFIEGPLKEENAFATKNTMLWGMTKKKLPNDETYESRKEACARVFAEMKYHHYGKLTVRMCELSSVAHLNAAGARAYADAIIGSLRQPLMAQHKWTNR